LGSGILAAALLRGVPARDRVADQEQTV